MANSKYTPGPLRIEGTHLVDDIAEEPLPHAVIRDSTERWVALVEITDDEGLGNAHLIAAAPAMYEALVEFLQCGPNAGHNQDLIVMVRAALAQAEGKP